MSKSIAFLKFKSLLEFEIRTFWHVLASLEYADRWLASANPTRLTTHAGDSRNPFKSIDISPSEFAAEHLQVASHIRENALVSFVTSFECYLAELLERVIYIEPSTVSDSTLQFTAKDISSALPIADIKRWIATRVADKYLRNKTHAEMISKLDTACKAGVSNRLDAEIKEWSRWSLVRNSIVHTARQVTPELAEAWPTRFPAAAAQITLTDKEVARVHHLALTIAAALDGRAVETVIKKHDQVLLARELFVQRGIEDVKSIRKQIGSLMPLRLTKIDIEKTIADQRRNPRRDGWELSARDLIVIGI